MAALGASGSTVRPDEPIWVDFSINRGSGGWRAAVRADGWFPEHANYGDLAVLTLSASPPPEAAAAHLCSSTPHDGRTVKAFGYPTPLLDGVWAESRIVGPGGSDPDWVQLDALQSSGARVERGFSGAGVWDPAKGGVIGLVVAEYTPTDTKVAWMLPVESLASYWWPLRDLFQGSPKPRRQLSPTQVAELTDLLLAMPSIRDPQGRLALLEQLRPEIASAVPYSPQARLSVLNLVKTCQNYDGGLAELIVAVRLIDPDSLHSHDLADLAGRLLGQEDAID